MPQHCPLNGSRWAAVGSGTNSTVYALAVHDNELYVGGAFTQVDGHMGHQPHRPLERLDLGALGTGFDSTVRALESYNGNLYAGGYFTTADGSAASHIARWNGSSWAAVQQGTDGTVHALHVHDGDLFVGGDFDVAGSLTGANNIARSGTAPTGIRLPAVSTTPSTRWSPIPATSTSGGAFRYADGIYTLKIAMWDGSAWNDVPGGINQSLSVVESLVVQGSYLYMGGSFTTISTVTMNYISRFDGSDWNALGTGTDGTVYALAAYDDDDDAWADLFRRRSVHRGQRHAGRSHRQVAIA